jgi:hypothetical protein
VCNAGDADIVDTNSLSVSSVSVADNSLLVSWVEPALFNGIILSYDVEVKHTENNGVRVICFVLLWVRNVVRLHSCVLFVQLYLFK